MINKRTQLERVFCQTWYTLLGAHIEEIYIVADGEGSMGFYDRVHVVMGAGADEGDLIFPAHHCEVMQLLHVNKDQNNG